LVGRGLDCPLPRRELLVAGASRSMLPASSMSECRRLAGDDALWVGRCPCSVDPTRVRSEGSAMELSALSRVRFA
jgi:hypothetical protein